MTEADDVPEGRTDRRNDPSGWQRVLARSRNRLDDGKRGNGNRLATDEPPGKKLLGLTVQAQRRAMAEKA